MPNSQLREPKERLDNDDGRSAFMLHPAAYEELARFADENKNREETAKNLESGEKNAKGPNEGSLLDQEESTVDKPEWITKLSEKRQDLEKNRDKGLSRSKAYLRLAKRKGPLTAIILTLVGGGIGITSLLSPGLLIIQLKETMVNKFNTQLTSMSVRTKKVLTSKITSGSCSLIPIACKYSSMSTKQVARFKKAGIDIEFEDTTITGRVKPKKIIFEGEEILPKDFYNRLNTDAKFRLSVKKSYNPLFASFYDKVWNKTLFYIDKTGIHLADGDSDVKLKDIQQSTVDAVDDSKATMPDADSKIDTDENGIPKDGTVIDSDTANDVVNQLDDTAGTGVKAASEFADEAGNIVKAVSNTSTELTSKMVTDLVAGTALNTIKITGIIDNACMIYGATRAVGFAAKTVRAVQLIAYASIFLKIADQIKAGGNPNPEDVSYLGDILTKESTTINSDGSESKGSATDSFGYKYAAYGEITKMPDSATQFLTAAGFAGTLIGITTYINSVLGGSPNETCKISQNIFFQLGSAAVGIVAAIVSGGATAVSFGAIVQAVGGAAVAIAIAFLPALLQDIVAGVLVDDSTVGMLAGDAITSGSSSMMGKLASGGGNAPLTVDQAVAYANLSNKIAAEYAEEDRIAYSPFDATNANTFLGSFSQTILPYLTKISSIPNTIEAVSSLTSNSFASAVFPKTNAVRAEEFSLCQDLDYINMGLAADPFCNLYYGIPTNDLESIDPLEVLSKLYSSGDIDRDTGEVIIGSKLEAFQKDCINRENPIGYTGADFQSEDGKKCIIGESDDANTKYYYLYLVDKRVEDGMSGDDTSLEMAYEMGLDQSPNIAFYDGSNGLNNNIASESIFSKIINFFRSLDTNSQAATL